MVCPLAKLGRTSPENFNHHPIRSSPAYRDSPSLDYTSRSTPDPSFENSYLKNIRASPASIDEYRLSPSIHQHFTMFAESSFSHNTSLIRCSSPTTSLGRTSPCLDQGYHTLVTPSPPYPRDTVKSKRSHHHHHPPKHNICVFDRLSDDIVLKIFSWLPSSDICRISRVCRRWEVLAWEKKLWRTITLSGESISGDKAIRGILRRLCGQNRTGVCSNVEQIFLNDGAKVTDKGLTLLSRRCPELTHVQLQGSASLTNNSVHEMVARCTNLHHLDITGKYLGPRPTYTMSFLTIRTNHVVNSRKVRSIKTLMNSFSLTMSVTPVHIKMKFLFPEKILEKEDSHLYFLRKNRMISPTYFALGSFISHLQLQSKNDKNSREAIKNC